MTIEQSIKDVVEKKLEEGIVGQLIEQNLEKGIQKAIEDIFGSWGDGTKTIKKKIESVMIPYLEQYDYSKYILKLDHVLAEILKNTTTENRTLLENFKRIMSKDDALESITTTELFGKWIDFVEENVSTEGLEVDYDDGPPAYEDVRVRFDVAYDEKKYDWESFTYAKLIFECDKDEDINFAIRLSRWNEDRKDGFDISCDWKNDIRSLRHLNEFELFLMKLQQDRTRIVIDDEEGEEYVTPKEEPELTYR